MLSRPIEMIFVLFIVSLNFLIMLFPFALLFYPFILLSEMPITLPILVNAIKYLLLIISMLTIIYFFLDFLFGISVGLFMFKYKKYTKYKKYLPLLTEPFESVKKKYNKHNVSLLIKDDEQINAYAIGGIRKKVIVLTISTIETIRLRAATEEEAVNALHGILAHEMSHIVNGDYLPGLMININDQMVAVVQSLLDQTFRLLSSTLAIIPIFGYLISKFIQIIFNGTRYALSFINYKIIRKIYKFINIYLTRSIEYRSDHDSAKACGGNCMASALTLIANGYNNIFSTHPSTKNRIKKVQNIKPSSKTIYPNFLTEISNITSILLFFLIAIYLFFELEAYKLPSQILEAVSHLISKINSELDSLVILIKTTANSVMDKVNSIGDKIQNYKPPSKPSQ